MSKSRPRLVYVATDPLTAYRLMEGQLASMRRRGFDVTVITSPGELLEQVREREGVRAIAVRMKREIAPLSDLVALVRLVLLFRELGPDLVNAGTPKGGLLGVVAGRLAGVPAVVYLLRGLRFEGAKGVRRLTLVLTEHLAGALAHRVFVNGESLRQRFVELGCAPLSKTWIPRHGSSNGVDVERFIPSDATRAWARDERVRNGIKEHEIVIGFVGRFARDKGVADLAQAFRIASEQIPGLRLLLVGDFDDSDPLTVAVIEWLRSEPRVTITGFVREPARFYALMDIFAFPSYREGFPNAPLEAASAEIPTVAFRATGTVDAVLHGETGSIAPIGDVEAFAAALVQYARDPLLRRKHGTQARQRVEIYFRREAVWDAIAEEYSRLLKGVASPNRAPAVASE